MGEISIPILVHVVLFLIFPLVGGYIAVRLKAPPIIGYVVGGVVLRIYLGSQIATELLSNIASVGIILLLFAVGLEVRLSSLKRFGKVLIWVGILQLVICGGFIFILSRLFGIAFAEAVFVGASFALCSTAVVAKIIEERGEEHSLVGGLAMGVLVLQDLAVIPLIIILSSISGGVRHSGIVFDLALSVFKAAFVLVLVFFLGRRIVPTLFTRIAKSSTELLNLFTVFFIFATVFLFSSLGLSSAIAAFIAGVLVGQTLQHYHIFSQIRPMRDIFAILFFAFLGASINLSVVMDQLPAIVLFSLLVMLVKFTVVTVLFILFKFHSRTSFSMGIFLSQVGEFAFVIMHQGLTTAIVSQRVYLFALTSSLLTIVVTPILILKKDHLYERFNRFLNNHLPAVANFINAKVDRHPSHIDALPLKDHIIICGYGQVGSYVGRALQISQIPYVAVDYDFYKVEEARKKGIEIIYGDPTNIDILDYLQAEHAAAIVSAVPERFAQEMIILNARRLKKNITIFTRIVTEGDQQRMKDLGAGVVVQPEFEAALAIVRKVLSGFKVPKEEIVGKIKRLKIEHGMA